MKKNPKQIASLLCVILIVMVLIAMLVFAILGMTNLFRACLYAAITLPLLTWIYIFLYGFAKRKHTMASLDIGKSSDEPRDKPQ